MSLNLQPFFNEKDLEDNMPLDAWEHKVLEVEANILAAINNVDLENMSPMQKSILLARMKSIFEGAWQINRETI